MIPESLRRRPRWVLWHTVERDGRPTKVPTQVNGQSASVTNPRTWTTFAEAEDAERRGFVLGDGVVGVDLDHVRDPATGIIQPWAQRIINAVQGYTEVSPSGAGVHILAEALLPRGFKKGPIEVYGTGAQRYLTVTGEELRPWSDKAGARLAAVYPVLHDVAHFLASLPPNDPVRQDWLDKTSEDPAADESAYDWRAIVALARFFNDGNPQRIERALRLSGLVRAKWDERRGEVSWLQYSIGRALEQLLLTAPAFAARELSEIIANPMPDPVMLVEGLVEAVAINMVAGPAYAGKSTIGLDLALSVSAGLPVFSKFMVNGPVSVAYIYGEQGEARWEKRLREIVTFREVALDTRPARLWLVNGRGLRFNQPPVMSGFLAWCKEHEVGLVIFDPLSTLFPSNDENAASDVVRQARAPLEVLVSAGMTVIVTHHSTKGMGRDESARAGDLVRGSGDLQAMTSSIIGVQYLLGRQAISVKVQGRSESVAPFAVTAGGRPLGTDPRGEQPAWAPIAFAGWWQEVAEVDPEMKVLLLMEPGHEYPIEALISGSGLQEGTVRNYLTRLRRKGMVESKNGKWLLIEASAPYENDDEEASAL